jgi:hypothetical protein
LIVACLFLFLSPRESGEGSRVEGADKPRMKARLREVLFTQIFVSARVFLADYCDDFGVFGEECD